MKPESSAEDGLGNWEREAWAAAVQIYGDQILIDNITRLRLWPEQVAEDAAATFGERDPR